MTENTTPKRKVITWAVIGGIAAPFVLPAGLIIGLPAVWAGAVVGAALAHRPSGEGESR
ncbi:hypothetical protein [Cyanobium sp. Copco_Reservoir_LC18]|uniref:hypothetical protein n=1 Tax=Cyanobium sp. Copco_Reservoir_LC18 TaxID=1328305 RepID=UPI00135B3C83|nr:hypothetical protein [Cyanobium sp. Copco_Reservoir_LC18]